MNDDVATVAKELGELREMKSLLHGVRLDLNQIAKANKFSLASHELEAGRQRQRKADLEAALDSVRKADAFMSEKSSRT